MGATSPSGRTVISTSEWEMAARATIRENHAQDPTTLLGKMLRIDVNVPDGDIHGYRVPTDNPFLDNVPIPALPEIWDFGMRNPWRFSFDVGPGGTGRASDCGCRPERSRRNQLRTSRKGRAQLRLAYQGRDS